MTTTSSSLAPTHLGSQVARRWLGTLAPSMGSLVVLAIAAWTTPNLFGRGVVILGAKFVSGTRR
jgi:hypothetical protein